MVGLTTVALLERKTDISRSLFCRYWRDVHGVMAARIPGFATYTQYHVMPMHDVDSQSVEPFEGIAVVTFAKESDRAGLAHSPISKFIQRDEQNVFRRALLYNLPAGAGVCRLSIADASKTAGIFLCVPAAAQVTLESIFASLGTAGLVQLHAFDLRGGDPSAWNDTDIDDGGVGRRFATLLHGYWSSHEAAKSAVGQAVVAAKGQIVGYRIDATFVMVDGGRPTHLGLRGQDCLRTIQEAGAENQLEDAVETSIYGRF